MIRHAQALRTFCGRVKFFFVFGCILLACLSLFSIEKTKELGGYSKSKYEKTCKAFFKMRYRTHLTKAMLIAEKNHLASFYFVKSVFVN